MPRDEPAAAIRRVLLRERSLLRSGELDELPDLLTEKARCLAGAPEIGDPEELKQLQSLAERNQALLTAAAEGLRSATSRMAQLREGIGSLSTYGKDGGRTGPPRPSSKLERRA